MMETTPVAPFKMPKPEFLLQFLVIPFDDPAVFRHLHQFFESDTRTQGGNPVLRRFRFAVRPFDEQPLFRVWLRLLIIAMGRPDPDSGETGLQLPLRTFTPADLPESGGRQTDRQLFHRNRLMLRASL